MSSKLRSFTEDLLERVGTALSELLAHQVSFKRGQISAFDEEAFSPFGDFVACLSGAVTGAHEGTLYVAFDLPRVIVLGALLEMVPPDGIAERLAEPAFDEERADAFEEVGNILVGKVDEAIRDNLGEEKIHTKKGDTLTGTPGEVYARITEGGDYYCLEATVEIEGQESGPVRFLFHPPLVEEGFKADPEVTAWRLATAVEQEAEAAEGEVAAATEGTEEAAEGGVARAAAGGAEAEESEGG
ncbi:MAG: hypothetical protein D6739_01410, partial [Nitrospirae bacterium]